MAILETVNVKASDLMRDVTMTVNVKGMHVFAARKWLGLRVMRLAIHILGCGFKVES